MNLRVALVASALFLSACAGELRQKNSNLVQMQQVPLSTCSVGVIDGPVNARHLGNRIVTKSFLPKDVQSISTDHATATVSILTGSPSLGIEGLLPNSTIFAANVAYLNESGNPSLSTVGLDLALSWMHQQGVCAVEMGFSELDQDGSMSLLEKAAEKNIIMIAPVGNAGSDNVEFPSGHEDVIAITAVFQWPWGRYHLHPEANRGSHVEFALPGVQIEVVERGRKSFLNGTSFAGMFALAAVACQIEAGVPRDLNSIRSSLQQYVHDVGERGRDPLFGHGVLQKRSYDCQTN